MYFKLESQPGPRSGYLKQQNNKYQTLMRGSIVDEKDVVVPWQYIAVVSETYGLAMSDFYPGATVMSKRLVAALEATGVDNLQTFPAEIKHSLTGEVMRDHVAFNVVGMVSAADANASESTPLGDVQYFHRLVIEPTRAKGLLLFRLAESRGDIIVADKVADAIQAGGFTDVRVTPLAEAAAG